MSARPYPAAGLAAHGKRLPTPGAFGGNAIRTVIPSSFTVFLLAFEMEYEFEKSPRPLSPVKTYYHIPPDVNAGVDLFIHRRWYSRLALPMPALYIPHIATFIVFGVLSIVFGILAKDVLKESVPFWEVFPEFLVALIGLFFTVWIHLGVVPAFWRNRARDAVNEGWFDSSTRKSNQSQLVLELGCNEGSVSATFAREILRRQRDVGDLNSRHASMPVFIGYDRWTAWSRIPNTPACFLSTLMDAGVPRDSIIAHRMDRSSKETRTHLPYPSESISLIICHHGITELYLKHEERTELFRDMLRILEPGGRVLILESSPVGRWTKRDLWNGALGTYRRMLVEDLGWPSENVITQRQHAIWYLTAVKPSRLSLKV